MLWTVIFFLFLLWLAGIIFKLSMGGMLHIVLIVAVILLVFNLLRSAKTEHKSI